LHCKNPPQVVLIQSFFNFAPPRRGWFLKAVSLSCKVEKELIYKTYRKMELLRNDEHPVGWLLPLFAELQ
jgi:hypothetical protein